MSAGETRGFFGKVLASGYHVESIRMVREGSADASAIDSQVLAVELRADPSLVEELRVIDALGPATIQPVAVARHLPDDLKEGVRGALLAMAGDPEAREALDGGLVDRFVPIRDSDYDDIRMRCRRLGAAGFMDLR